MARGAPRTEPGDSRLRIRPPDDEAAGPEAILVTLERARGETGVVRGTRALYRLNRAGGFDCPGCAWPDPVPDERSRVAEFCENGAKAVAEEATLRRVGPEFFAAHTVSELATHSDYWLGQQGRLTEPVFKEAGDGQYRPIAWEDAFGVVAEELQRLDSPDRAVFYSSGKTSNEAAFCYQLFARALGTNNLPDCSNVCHESSGAALSETIGIGKGSVSLDDIHRADLILSAGQNPGTNHPRMLTALETAKRRSGPGSSPSIRSPRRGCGPARCWTTPSWISTWTDSTPTPRTREVSIGRPSRRRPGCGATRSRRWRAWSWSRADDGRVEERRAPGFQIVAYPTARGCAAAYFPETNVLVPLDSTAQISNTPTSKSIVVRLQATAPHAAVAQEVAR